MKKSFVVYIEQGIGHEYHNAISETAFYGPFTEIQANRLAGRLNKIFDRQDDPEHEIASVMRLGSFRFREIVAKYQEAGG